MFIGVSGHHQIASTTRLIRHKLRTVAHGRAGLVNSADRGTIHQRDAINKTRWVASWLEKVAPTLFFAGKNGIGTEMVGVFRPRRSVRPMEDLLRVVLADMRAAEGVLGVVV